MKRMTGHTYTVDDFSPLIEYQPEGAWFQQSDDADAGETRYYGGSFTYTEAIGATASFSFNGTSVLIHGAKGVDYGTYSVNIDGTTHDGAAFTYSLGEPEVPLVNISSLRQGPHVVTLLNTGYSRLDIDCIIWTSDIGSLRDGKDHHSENIVEDTSDAFEYHPEEAWSSQSNMSGFMGSTGHTTSTSKASVTYTFSGDIVSLYGTTGPRNSPYTVQLDDWPNKTFQGNKTIYNTQSLLYHADNLGPGKHTLVITNEADSKLQIDYAQLLRVATSPSRSQPPIPGPTGDFASQGKGLDGAQIAGITIGGVFLLALIVSLFLVTRRNRTLWNRLQRGYMVQSQFDYSSPSVDSGYHVATGSKSSRNGSESMAQASQQELGHSRNMSEVPMLRTLSLVSNMSSSASTLVAEDGSNAGARRPHRGKRVPHRAIGNPSSMSQPSLGDAQSTRMHNSFVGRQAPIAISPNHSEPSIWVVGPEGQSMNGNSSRPSWSLAAQGRTYPGPAKWADVHMENTHIHRERSTPSPIPALLTESGEVLGLIEPGHNRSPSGSGEYSRLVRPSRPVHGPRTNEDPAPFRAGRYI